MAPREPREGHVENNSASEFGQVNQQSPVFNNPNSPTFNPNRGPPEQQLSGTKKLLLIWVTKNATVETDGQSEPHEIINQSE